jgi:hypothetical protein
MSKLTHMPDRPSGATPTAIGLLDARIASLINRTHVIGLNPHAAVTVCGLLFIGLVGWINFHAAKGLNFEYFYLLGCALVGWIAGARGALVCTLASAVLLSFAEIAAQGSALSIWVLACNSLVRLVAFGSIGWLAAEVGRSTRDLQQTVEHRTARGGDFLNWEPLPLAQHVDGIKSTDADVLLREAEAAIRDNLQARASAVIHKYGQLNHPPRPVFDLMLRYAVSEDGALHAEKYYNTVREEFTSTRPAFRWRQLVALARVTASECGRPAPGVAQAKELLKV